MANPLFLVAVLILLFPSPILNAKEADPNDPKAVCAQSKAEIKQLEKQRLRAMEGLKPIEARQEQAKQKFQEFRSRLAGFSGCSKGNSSNTSECEEVLAGLARSGDELSRIQDEMVVAGKKKDAIETQLLLPNEKLKAYRCQ